jgi:PAS domain S-box-containing protein
MAFAPRNGAIIDLPRLFSSDGFMPHGMCYMWRPDILAVHVGADSSIALAYFTIPFTLVYFVRKRAELHFTWIFLSFAIFIVACGVSHVLEIWTIWFPNYWLSGGVKIITALASVMTAILLVKLVPAAVRFPTASALLAANENLAREILERKVAEQKVIEVNASLEARVLERTQQLAAANQRLIQINARFAIASGAAELGFWDLDVAAQTLLWDDQMFELYGRPREAAAQPYELWTSSLHPEDRAGTEKALLDALAGGDRFATEFRIVRPSGETRHIKVSAAVIRDATGSATLMHGVNFDITEHRLGSEAQQQMAALVQSTSDAIITKDMRGIIRSWNAAAEEMLGYTAEEIIGQSVARLIPADHETEESGIMARIKHGQRIVPFETVRLMKDGTSVEVTVTVTPIFGDAGQIVGASKIVRDMTPARLSAEALQAVNVELKLLVKTRTAELKERESLLQEVHHRVKNNLQIISSLINRQVRGLEDESSRAALQDCQSRVMAMAQIHEMLYQSADYARVPFAKYARELAERVLIAAGNSNGAVGLHFELEDLSLRVEHAIPCALILNELVANALKHAFPNGAIGTIRVEFRQAPDHSVFLSVGDDGTGISRGLDLENLTSVGVQLVRTLVKQLEGRLEIIRAPGSNFRITFPLESRA